jgi:hypothetical protein
MRADVKVATGVVADEARRLRRSYETWLALWPPESAWSSGLNVGSFGRQMD